MIQESPVIETLDISFQERSGEWVTLNNKATRVEIIRGGKRAGVSTKIDVGTATVQLFGDLDVDASASLHPNTPVRVAARNGKPGLSLYTMPTPYVSDSAWIRTSQGGYTLTPAVQSRPALGHVPAGNKFAYGFTSSASGSNPYTQLLAYRMVWGGNFVPGRRYRVSARANDLTAENNVPIRLIVTAASGLIAEGKPRALNANAYTEVPSVTFVMPEAITGSFLSIGFGMSRMLPMPAGAAGTFMGVYLSDFVIEQLPQEPDAVFTGRLTDLTQSNELDKTTGTARTFTTLFATDAVSVHANTPRYGAVTDGGGGFEVWENRMNRLAASAQAPVEVPKEQTEKVLYVSNGYQPWTALSAPLAPLGQADWSTYLPVRESWPQPQVWEVDYRKIGTAGTYAPGTLGIQRTFTDLTPGRTYRFEAYGTRSELSAVKDFRLGVAGIGAGASTPISADPGYTKIGAYQFTATGTSHVLQVTNSISVTLTPGNAATETVNIRALAMRVIETGLSSPYRLQDVVFESDLASHFDLASNSVGGRWWVDTQGVTQLRQGTEPEPLKGVWTDRPATLPGYFEYVDVQTTYDTRALVTALELGRKGRKVDEEGKESADDTSTVFVDAPAVQRWGVRSDTLTTSLYAGQGFEQSLQMRADEVFTDFSNSQRTITGFRWNAQEDTAQALSMDIYDAVRVESGPLPVNARIISLKHSITPRRWMVDVALTDIRAGVTWDELNAAVGSRTWAQVNTALGGRTWAELNADPLGPFAN